MAGATLYPKTPFRVIIVGAGFGGLTTAIECTLKGHTAVIVEKADVFQPLGDIISIAPNGGRIMSRWDKKLVHDKLEPICMHHLGTKLQNKHGQQILFQPATAPNPESPVYNGNRAAIHKVFYEYAKSLNVEFNMGREVISYGVNETETGMKPIVKTRSGETFEGDVVVAADGVHTRAREQISGSDVKLTNSGYSAWRASFNAEESGVTKDPLTKEFVEGGDTHTGWLGDDMHFLVASYKGGTEISWVCTRKDNSDPEEPWTNKGNIKDVLNRMKDWDPRCLAIVSKSPSCTDYKLVCREPLSTWVSPHGGACLLGDAARSFLPTSIQGCSQAIEDGCVLATCLALSYKEGSVSSSEMVSRALRAYARLRYERVKSVQRTGEDLLNLWHKCDYKTVHLNPQRIRMPRKAWVTEHDSESFTKGMWDHVLAELRGGPPIPKENLACGMVSE